MNGLSTAGRTYVGYGFGAIQAGLFLYEAFRSGAFRRLSAVEVVSESAAHVRRNDGFYGLNIAHSDRVETVSVGPLEIEDPGSEADRRRIVDAVSEAEEIGTALPSVLHQCHWCKRHELSPNEPLVEPVIHRRICRLIVDGSMPKSPRTKLHSAGESRHHIALCQQACYSRVVPMV